MGRVYHRLDPSGLLVDGDDRPVLGVSGDAPTLEPVYVPPGFPPVATTEVRVGVNLNPNALGAGPFDPFDPDASSDFQSSIALYAPRRFVYFVDLHFANLGDDTWLVSAIHPVAGLLGQMMLRFDEDGTLDAAVTEVMRAPWDENGTEAWHLRFTRQTQSMPGESKLESVDQDGQPGAGFASVHLTPRGEVRAEYSNGVVASWWILDGLEGWLLPL